MSHNNQPSDKKITFDDILQKFTSLNLLQKSIDWEEDLPEELYDLLDEMVVVADNLNIDKHRWYETCITVFQYGGRFMGVEHICDSYSENQEIADCFHHLKFFEMKQQKIETYTYIKV